MAYSNRKLPRMVSRRPLKIGSRYFYFHLFNYQYNHTFCFDFNVFYFVLLSSFQIGNPWEIVRNDIRYPIKFYGKVVVGSDGKKNWIGGEDIEAVAYDVPIPGYKTKNTISLRLWSTKAPTEDFDLAAFNAGEHTRASEALASAEKVQITFFLEKGGFALSLCFVVQFVCRNS